MNKDKKQKLVELGADILADAMLEMANRNEEVGDLVERLIAPPAQNVLRFKAKLSRLQLTQRFIPWNEAAGFAYDLVTLLEDLKAGVTDACTGVELIAEFYENDKSVFDHCDDSNGDVGDVFRYQARDLYVAYASGCHDKEWLCNLVIELNKQDEYGVRRELIDCATEYLPEPIIRKMVSRLQDLADMENFDLKKRHWYIVSNPLRYNSGTLPSSKKPAKPPAVNCLLPHL